MLIIDMPMPKEGEWKVEEITEPDGLIWCRWYCSHCGEVVTKGWRETKDGRKPKYITTAPTAGRRWRLTMGRWYTPQEWVRKFMPKKGLRQSCLEMYGEDFARKYDALNMGIPIGDLEETKAFLSMVEAAKMKGKENDDGND